MRSRVRVRVGGSNKLAQKSSTCFVPTVVAVDEAFLIARVAAVFARPRALPSAEFAPLSHVLMSGFSWSKGFLSCFTIA